MQFSSHKPLPSYPSMAPLTLFPHIFQNGSIIENKKGGFYGY